MTVQRANGGGVVMLPATYVSEHLELAYASSAHRAQGRTVDTAHALVSSTTTREVLYVMATRGRASNRLYVDTHYDPDPQTSHDQANEPVTAKEVLAGVLLNEGADVAAHDMIQRQLTEAEGMERLSAEYLTLATLAQQERWDSLLARSGLSDADLAAVRASAAYGPLLTAFRDAEARGLDIEATLPSPGRRPVPGRRRRCGRRAARPSGALDPGRQRPQTENRQSDRRAYPPGPACQRPRDGPSPGRAGPGNGSASPYVGRPSRRRPGRVGYGVLGLRRLRRPDANAG